MVECDMRYYTITSLLILFLLLTTPCHARDLWMPEDTALQLSYTALSFADWSQTRAGIRSNNFYETNGYLGGHPSARRVDTYFASTIVLNAAIAYVLPQPWRRYFQVSSLTIEGSAVWSNYNLGIGMRF